MSATSAIMVAAAAKRHRLIRHFVQARAFSPDTAIACESLPRTERLLRVLREQGILVTAPSGKLYLDQSRLERVGNAKKVIAVKMVVTATFVVVALSAIAYFLASA